MAVAKQPIADTLETNPNLNQDFRKDWTETTRKDWKEDWVQPEVPVQPT
jgi:hypothetical protein